MIFLFLRWDMLIPWWVTLFLFDYPQMQSIIHMFPSLFTSGVFVERPPRSTLYSGQPGFCGDPKGVVKNLIHCRLFNGWLVVHLGGGFKDVLFSPLPGEDSHFDVHSFQMGWNHQPGTIPEQSREKLKTLYKENLTSPICERKLLEKTSLVCGLRVVFFQTSTLG